MSVHVEASAAAADPDSVVSPQPSQCSNSQHSACKVRLGASWVDGAEPLLVSADIQQQQLACLDPRQHDKIRGCLYTTLLSSERMRRRLCRIEQVYTSTTASASKAWNDAMHWLGSAAPTRVSGPAMYGYNEAAVQQLRKPAPGPPQDRLNALRQVLGVQPPAPAVSSSFVLPVEQLSERRRNELLLVARPIVQSVLRMLHDRDPDGVISALLADRAFRAAAGMDTHAAKSATQLQQDPTMQRVVEAYQSAADLGLKPLQNQLLSLVASDHTRVILCELFSCSGRQVNNARMHTALYGRGEVPVSSRHACCSSLCTCLVQSSRHSMHL